MNGSSVVRTNRRHSRRFRELGVCSGWNPQHRFLKSASPEVAMWDLPPSDVVLYGLSLVALAAQAMTAALAAGRRSMDWVGVCLLGCITALGGGTIRDVVLGHYPLPWVENPSYLGLTAAAAFATVLIARTVHRLNLAF